MTRIAKDVPAPLIDPPWVRGVVVGTQRGGAGDERHHSTGPRRTLNAPDAASVQLPRSGEQRREVRAALDLQAAVCPGEVVLLKDYYHGRFDMDDSELWENRTHREGNVLIPHEHHGVVLEEKIMPILEELYKEGKKELSTSELTYEIGKRLENEENKEDSIIYWCYKNDIPFFVPGPTDGTVGSNLWMFSESHPDFKLNLFKDEHELNNIVLDAGKTGSLMIGGGISKHHTIWWNQFRGGLDYSVYITTAPEWDGSLSGARVKEGISWGKVREDAKYITIEGDATTILPLMISSLIERLK
ncbi:MAG: deoxyhypusine synthase family protein [Candidatus Undinarchaeales archaeon]